MLSELNQNFVLRYVCIIFCSSSLVDVWSTASVFETNVKTERAFIFSGFMHRVFPPPVPFRDFMCCSRRMTRLRSERNFVCLTADKNTAINRNRDSRLKLSTKQTPTTTREFNVLFQQYAKERNPSSAFELLEAMNRSGINRDIYTYNAILNVCARGPLPDEVTAPHRAASPPLLRCARKLRDSHRRCSSRNDAPEQACRAKLSSHLQIETILCPTISVSNSRADPTGGGQRRAVRAAVLAEAAARGVRANAVTLNTALKFLVHNPSQYPGSLCSYHCAFVWFCVCNYQGPRPQLCTARPGAGEDRRRVRRPAAGDGTCGGGGGGGGGADTGAGGAGGGGGRRHLQHAAAPPRRARRHARRVGRCAPASPGRRPRAPPPP